MQFVQLQILYLFLTKDSSQLLFDNILLLFLFGYQLVYFCEFVNLTTLQLKDKFLMVGLLSTHESGVFLELLPETTEACLAFMKLSLVELASQDIYFLVRIHGVPYQQGLGWDIRFLSTWLALSLGLDQILVLIVLLIL